MLSPYRVLDLTDARAALGPMILADLGADVIRVEPPAGDPGRWAEPLIPGAPRELSSARFHVFNRNKRSVILDVRTEAGRDAFLELVRVSDVVVENFRPGTLERYKLGPDELQAVNPRIVVLRASGFGQTGPYSARSAFNPVALALGGLTYLNGWPDRPPLRDGVTAGDYTAALFNLQGALAALVRRERDGLGQVVDVAMYEAVLRMTGDTLALRSALGIRREREGGDSPLYPAALTAAAADGRYVAISGGSWDAVIDAFSQMDEQRPDAGRGAAKGEPSE